MNNELVLKYNRELSHSEPITLDGIRLYPVKYKDYIPYTTYAHCLIYNPVYYHDMELSILPRLYFLTEIFRHADNTDFLEAHKELKKYLLELYGLLSLVLQGQRFEFEPNEAGRFCLKIYEENGEQFHIFNAKKFDTMREIILTQNNTFYDDEYIHPDIQRWIAEQKAAEQKKSKTLPETIEDRIEVLMLEFGNSDEGFLDNLTIRRVERLLEKVNGREVYQAQLNGMMSGMIQFKEQPTSWFATKPRQTDFERYLKELH